MNANHVAGEPSGALGEIESLKSQFDVFRFLKRTADLFGFKGFLVLKLPLETSLLLSENAVISNLPAEFMNEFDRLGLMRGCGFFAKLRHSTVPVAFEFAKVAEDRPVELRESAKALFTTFGYVQGFCMPVHDAAGHRSAVLFVGERGQLSYNEVVELTMICLHAFQRLMDVSAAVTKDIQVLTARELDCLQWTAAGKTSSDIAAILSLSEHTVNHYLNRAAKKLDTVNRTQAVAKALRRGLIN
jgi:LuxR family quorum sensing-dependent transcriptional regulator